MHEQPESDAPAPRRVISVALIEDNRLVREGLVTLLNQHPDLRVVAEGSNGETLLLEDVKPQVVLLDEPSAGLPTAEALAFAEVVRRLAGDTTLIFCAHDMDLVFGVADRVILLHYGEIVCEGTSDEIRANPMVRDIYMGTRRSFGPGHVSER